MAIDERVLLRGFIGTAMVTLLLGGLSYTYVLYRNSQNQVVELTRQLEVGGKPDITDKSVIEKVARHYLLPDGEPKLVTVRNADELRKDQPFFANATDGDILLVYSTIVILYSPEKDRIVEVARIRPESETTIPLLTPPSETDQ